MLLGQDRAQFDRLAAAMPPSARALTDLANPGGGRVNPRDALQTIMEITLDQVVREGARNSRDIGDVTQQEPGIGGDLISALTRREDRRLDGTPAGLRHLQRRLAQWREPLETAPDWTLAHLLQARHDPGILKTAQEVWRGERLENLQEPGFNPRRFMEREQRRLGDLCPAALTRYGKDGEPLDTPISLEAVHEIISEHAADLAYEEFRVLVRADWTKAEQDVRIEGAAKPCADGSTGLAGLDALMDFDWRIALDDVTISAEEMDRIAEATVPLIRLRNGWLDATSSQVQHAVRRWRSRPRNGTRARDVLAAIVNPEDHAPEVQLSAGDWLGNVARQLESRQPSEPRHTPATLQGELRPYQARGYSWMEWLTGWGLGACLADDMGLGKTITTLAILLADQEDGISRPALVVCPTSLLGNWRRETERFAPSLGVHTHHGQKRAQNAEELRELAGEARLVITSYGTLQRDNGTLADTDWRTVVLDEAQNVKNPDSQRAKAARELRGERRIALTGTPVENHAGDLWAIMQFLNPGLLGTRDGFRRRFTLPLRDADDEETAETLHRITAPFVLRRMKSDPEIAPDLPEKFENKVHCAITREQASLYSAVLRDLEERLEEAEGIERLGLIFQTTTRLKQVCNHPAQLPGEEESRITGRSGKLTRLLEMAEETSSNGQKSIVFTQYVQMGRILQNELGKATGSDVPFLHGAVRPKERDRMVESFQTDPKTKFIVVSVRAGGHGLNLTAATNVFHYDRWWNPAVENQASDRAFRIGQTKDVQVHKMVCLGTLEEKIDRIIDTKGELAERLVGSGEDWLGRLSNNDLREVLTLSEEV